MRIAIIGSGVSGLVTADALHPRHDITVFESSQHIGGHAHTVRVDLAHETHEVDTGFVVYNERNYPHFTRLLRRVNVASKASDMSFSVSDERTGLEYRATNANTMFAQRRNLLRPSFHRMLVDIARFQNLGRALLTEPESELTLGEFIETHRFSETFVEDFLIPLGASIWSADPTTYDRFPMVALASFLHNHGLLSLGDQPQWRTIDGGSQRYVKALAAPFRHRIQTSTPVHSIARLNGRVEVRSARGREVFDAVVLSCHSDHALQMLADPSRDEREVLGAIRYQPNEVTLHTDARFLPATRRAWASWNYHVLRHWPRRATLTYRMNSLQSLESTEQLLVTLNRTDDIDPNLVLRQFTYEHPVYDPAALAAQRRCVEIQGVRNTWFTGAYWGWGFHEDGVRSGLDVADALTSGRSAAAPTHDRVVEDDAA